MEMFYLIAIIIIIFSPVLIKYLVLRDNYKGKERILSDKTELTLLVNNGSRNLSYNQIKKIVISECKRRKFFIWPITDACISIYSRSAPQPFKFYRSYEKDKFEKYIERLQKFCKKNHIKLENELNS